jgi:hypothetical protein
MSETDLIMLCITGFDITSYLRKEVSLFEKSECYLGTLRGVRLTVCGAHARGG